jgi:hypothetical protein
VVVVVVGRAHNHTWGGGFGIKSKNRPVRAQFRVRCWKRMLGVMAGVGGVWEMRWLCRLRCSFNNLCGSWGFKP